MMLKDLREFISQMTGTGTGTVATATATASVSVATNLGLVNQILGAISIVVGIFACVCLARVHLRQGKLLDEQIKKIQEENAKLEIPRRKRS